MTTTDTIAAIATPPGRGGVGVVRVSGPLAVSLQQSLVGQSLTPRAATYTSFRNAAGQAIDQGIALFFPQPHSFTGEDVLELQGHGGPVVMDAILQTLLAQGVRLANPGEFSQRAFLNNKVDLAQAEAILDLINASSWQAAQSAMRSLQGAFSHHIQSLQQALMRLRMLVEAAIDFPEEEIDFLTEQDVAGQCQRLIEQITQTLHDAQQGVLLREGMTVVIMGKPNAGKSSLLNCLTRRDSAIVTEIPGTTRDLLREFIQLDGLPLHIIDTAGLRQAEDEVELEGIRRAEGAMQQADLVLVVRDASLQDPDPIKPPAHVPCVVVYNKIDLTGQAPALVTDNHVAEIYLSAQQNLGIDLVEQYLKQFMGYQDKSETPFIARRRHLDALHKTRQYLSEGLAQLKTVHAGELLAEDLRQAQHALSEITGEVTPDDLLGEIFSNFCIGK